MIACQTQHLTICSYCVLMADTRGNADQFYVNGTQSFTETLPSSLTSILLQQMMLVPTISAIRPLHLSRLFS
jgi:hypothetical protein